MKQCRSFSFLFLVFLFTFFSGCKQADKTKKTSIDVQMMQSLNLPLYPSTHILSNDNELLFSHYGLLDQEDLEKALEYSSSNIDNENQKLIELLKSTFRNDLSNKKLVVITYASSFADCPPCDRQNEIIEEISSDIRLHKIEIANPRR